MAFSGVNVVAEVSIHHEFVDCDNLAFIETISDEAGEVRVV